MSIKKQTILDLFELDKLPPEKAAETVDKLGKLVFQSVLIRVLPLLSKDDMEAYDKIVGQKDGGEELLVFLSEKVPNFEDIIKEEAKKLQSELAQEFKKAGV